MTNLSTQDLEQLKLAVKLLETPSLTIKMTQALGIPVDFFLNKLPDSAQSKIHKIIESALYKFIDFSAKTMKDGQSNASPRWHKLAAATSGAAGGFFGFAGIALELPVSTTIMMRSVLDIARSEGFSIQEPETRLACLEVFSFTGNTTDKDDLAESGYYAARTALTKVTQMTTEELVKIIATKSVGKAGTGVLGLGMGASTKDISAIMAKLIDAIATRLGVVLTEKSAAQLVPVIGAATAATFNTLFTNFYQDMARGHFTVKRLEKKYGSAEVKALYQDLLLSYSQRKS